MFVFNIPRLILWSLHPKLHFFPSGMVQEKWDSQTGWIRAVFRIIRSRDDDRPGRLRPNSSESRILYEWIQDGWWAQWVTSRSKPRFQNNYRVEPGSWDLMERKKALYLGMQTGRVQNGTMLDSDPDPILIEWFRFWLEADWMVLIPKKKKNIEGFVTGSDYSSDYNFES